MEGHADVPSSPGEDKGAVLGTRYILMRHMPSGANRAWLRAYATVVSVVSDGWGGGIDIVEVKVRAGEAFAAVPLDQLASHQLAILQGGLEARSDRVFRDMETAGKEAEAVLSALRRRVSKGVGYDARSRQRDAHNEG